MMATSLVHTIKMYEACLQCFIKSRKIMQKSVNCFDLLQQSRFMKNGPVLFDGSDAIDDVTNNMSHLTEWDQDNYGKDHARWFIDWMKLKVKAGNGGDGKAHLKRGRNLLGPDGGDGGKGGDVIIFADLSVKQLKGIKKHYSAENGGNGMVDHCKGKTGKNLVIKVPIGTVIKNQETSEVIADLACAQSSFIVAKGGSGGMGNANFKSSTDQRTLDSTPGEIGEEISIEIEMKSIADVGLVGFPNAGKSTLLRALSRAKPAVASYPFTTLKPNIGVIMYKDMVQIAVADIPGLVKDAHLNRGLGHSFLRHIERCSSLLYVIDVSEDDFMEKYMILKEEITLYQPRLLELPTIIVANKIDLIENHKGRLNSLKFEANIPVVGISGRNLINTEKLKIMIRELVSSVKSL